MNKGDTPDLGGGLKGKGDLGTLVLTFSALSFRRSDLDPIKAPFAPKDQFQDGDRN